MTDLKRHLTDPQPPLVCGVCKINEAIGVAASQLGPYSRAICRPCAMAGAEEAGMLEFTYDECDGKVADWVRKYVKAYRDGGYISWDEWAKSYAETKVGGDNDPR